MSIHELSGVSSTAAPSGTLSFASPSKHNMKSSSTKASGKYIFVINTLCLYYCNSGAGGLEDLERIYVDLENLDDAVDALAFEANVYTAGLTFASLEHAYIRLVNADTNQEVESNQMRSSVFSIEHLVS